MPSRFINKRPVFNELAGVRDTRRELFWCDRHDFASLWCSRLAFMNLYGDENLATFCDRPDDLVAMDAAPGWDVAFYARISAGDNKYVTILEGVDFVLCANDRHGT